MAATTIVEWMILGNWSSHVVINLPSLEKKMVSIRLRRPCRAVAVDLFLQFFYSGVYASAPCRSTPLQNNLLRQLEQPRVTLHGSPQYGGSANVVSILALVTKNFYAMALAFGTAERPIICPPSANPCERLALFLPPRFGPRHAR